MLPAHGLAHASSLRLFPVTPQSLSPVYLSSEWSQYFVPKAESLFILSLFTCPYILRVLVPKLLTCLLICFTRSFSCSMTPVIKLQCLFFPCDSDSKPSACPSECSCSFRRAFLPQPSLGSVFPHKLIYKHVWESSSFLAFQIIFKVFIIFCTIYFDHFFLSQLPPFPLHISVYPTLYSLSQEKNKQKMPKKRKSKQTNKQKNIKKKERKRKSENLSNHESTEVHLCWRLLLGVGQPVHAWLCGDTL